MAKLSYPATTAYKQWVWKKLRDWNGDGTNVVWTLQMLVDKMKRIDRSLTKITTSTLIQILGPEEGPNPPSNTTLMPVMNRALGIAPPPECNPGNTLEQLRDRFTSRWSQLTQREKQMILAALGHEDEPA